MNNSVVIKDYIVDIPDFPKPWIIFKDISPLLLHPEVFSSVVDTLAEKIGDTDVIVGLDARGFIFWSTVAYKLQKPFVMIRKKWKLPGKVMEDSYDLEYGDNIQVLQQGVIHPGQKVAIVDDVLATGGTMRSACHLIETSWGIVQWCYFLMILDFLDGQKKLEQYPISWLVHY